MTFDATINLGHILTFFGFVIGGLGVIWALKSNVQILSGKIEGVTNRLTSMEEKWESVPAVLTDLAVQKVRLDNMDRRIDDLQHGRGFVLDAFPSRETKSA
jgi:hypothetical protein